MEFTTLPTSELYELLELHQKLMKQIQAVIDFRDMEHYFSGDLPVIPKVTVDM